MLIHSTTFHALIKKNYINYIEFISIYKTNMVPSGKPSDQTISKKYILSHKIGSGAFGEVFKVKNK